MLYINLCMLRSSFFIVDVAVNKRIQRSTDYQNFNHKPILNCEGYKPEIKEEQPIGTPVINVK